LTNYSIMARAVNIFGTGYTSITGFTTLPVQTIPSVSINYIVTDDTTTTLIGDIISDGYSNILSKGILYSGSTVADWTDWPYGSGLGVWTTILSGLTEITQYWAKSYAINSIGTGYSSNIVTWTTETGNVPPVFSLNSPDVISFNFNSAQISSLIVSDGGSAITSRGIKYSGSTMSDWVDIQDPDQTIGEYITDLINLNYNSIYYVYSYATNVEGTTLTNTITFTTSNAILPTVETLEISDIQMTTADIINNASLSGDFDVISRGFYLTGVTSSVWVDSGVGLGKYNTSLTGLTSGQSYTGRSYATNIAGTGLGSLIYFNTIALNNLTIGMTISSQYSVNPLLYQIGDVVNDIVTTVNINRGNLPLNLLISGNTEFTASPLYGSPTTGLTWGSEVITANNITYPYTYSPIQEESQYFIAKEYCGSPVEIKTTSVEIKSVYPFLTSNRSTVSRGPKSPIPTEEELNEQAKLNNAFLKNKR
jgi:hypothetical protein